MQKGAAAKPRSECIQPALLSDLGQQETSIGEQMVPAAQKQENSRAERREACARNQPEDLLTRLLS